MSEKITLNVTGMTCTNCALTVTKVLERDGLRDVTANFVTGEVSFENESTEKINRAVQDIHKLGYRVVQNSSEETGASPHHGHAHDHSESGLSSTEKRFYWSLVFSVPLMLHMILPFHVLMLPTVQLLLCLPVMVIGAFQFGKSAWLSLKSGVPNMDVLIALGSGAAFIYSVAGMTMYAGALEEHRYLFFETAAAIITFVLLGNVIEHRSVRKTTSAIAELSKLKVEAAKKIIQTEQRVEQVIEMPIDKIRKNDLLLVNAGDKIPLDGIITWGTASVNESMITGESIPVSRDTGSPVIGGTLVESGSIKMQVLKTGNDTVLANIIHLVKQAQLTKPEIQKLGDRVSAIFVPAVILIALITLLGSVFFGHISFRDSLMRSIAVLVISCPCAMGLATPTAVMVGIGRAAKKGILIKGGSTLESLAKIKTMVFDKTGTLTTGNFRIKKIQVYEGDENVIKSLIYSLEKHSSHPIAKSITGTLAGASDSDRQRWKKVEEVNGVGIHAWDEQDNLYSIGSVILVKHLHTNSKHHIYMLKNNHLIAGIDMEDDIKPGTKEIIDGLKKHGIKTVLLSGWDPLESTCRHASLSIL